MPSTFTPKIFRLSEEDGKWEFPRNLSPAAEATEQIFLFAVLLWRQNENELSWLWTPLRKANEHVVPNPFCASFSNSGVQLNGKGNAKNMWKEN